MPSPAVSAGAASAASAARPAPLVAPSSSRVAGVRSVRPSAAVRASVSSSRASRSSASSARPSARASVVARAAASPSAPWSGRKPAKMVLADGSVWKGLAFGAETTEIGEVVFNTSMTGYQEILTDPSYKGQFVVFTYPHLGNVGVNAEDVESSAVHLGGVICRDLSSVVSNYRAQASLSDYLAERGVVGLAGVDTRAITRRLRSTGCLNGAITSDMALPDAELLAQARAWSIEGQDLIKLVTCAEPYEWTDPTAAEWEFEPAVLDDEAKNANADRSSSSPSSSPLPRPTVRFHVVAYDYGIKTNILRRLASFGCRVTVVPADYPADKVLALNPDGVFFSNGPGDPSAVPYAVDNAKQLLGKRPAFGICMGHQIIGQALGATTFKLPFGHHGGNHPIRHQASGRVEISAQNHNFAVDPATLPETALVSHVNLNDGTCAGLVVPTLEAMTIQYHPEASPGPHDADVCFKQFVQLMEARKALEA